MSLVEIKSLLSDYAWIGKFKKNKANVTLANNTLKDEDVTVPAGLEWTVLRGQIYNGDDVARDCSVICYDSADVEMRTLDIEAALAATTRRQFPRNNQTTIEDPYRNPLVLEAGDYVRFKFKAGGASAGGTGLRMLHVLERPARK